MRIVLGIVSGFILGTGVALLLFSYAKVAIGTNAFPAVIIGGVVLGLVVGILGSRVRRPSPAAPEGAET